MFYVPPALALIFFLVYLAQIQGQPFFKYLVANPAVYDGEARQLVAGTPPGHPFFLSALYPGLVSLVYAVSGSSNLALAVVQGLLLAASVYLLGRLARRLLSPWTALGASLAMAFYWSFHYFAGEMVPATLFVALMLAGTLLVFEPDAGRRQLALRLATLGSVVAVASMYAGPGLMHLGSLLAGHALPQPAESYWAGLALVGLLIAGAAACLVAPWRWRRLAGTGNLAAAGFALGAGALAWSGALALGAVFILGLARERGRRTGAAVLAVGLALPVLAALAHNYTVSRDLIPITSSFGVNVFIGNNQASDGADPFRFGPGNRVKLEADRLGLSGKRRSDFYTARALESIAEAPGRWLGLEARKVLIWIGRTEVNNNADIAERKAAWRLFFAPRLHFGIVFPLAAVGALAAFRRNRKALWLVAAYLSFLAVPLVFFACERFRLPAVVFLLPLAALGTEALVGLARARRLAGLLPALGALAAGAAVYNIDFLGISDREMPSIVSNKAYVERLAGNYDKARGLALRALALDPADAGGLYQIGALDEAAGRRLEALRYYLDCLQSDPFFYAAYQSAAAILAAEKISVSYLDAYVDEMVRGEATGRKADLMDFLRDRASRQQTEP